MDLLGRLMTGSLLAQGGGKAPHDDFWYRAVGEMTAAGIRLDAEGAQKVSAYYRGVDILSTSLAMLPFTMNMRLPNDGGRDRAASHSLDDVIGRKPNAYQDSFQWRRQQMRWLIHHGNGYNRIVSGRGRVIDQLLPIHPRRVKPVLLDSGYLAYNVREKDNTVRTYTQDEIFHLRGATDDGVEGKGLLEYARDSLALGLVLESYAAKLFGRGALHGGTISVAGVLNDEASKRMAESFITSVGNWHMPKVLEQGATWTQSTMTPEDAQMLLSRKFSVNDIARWLGLPPHMLGDLERSTNNNIEWQGQEFVTYNLGPWLSLWEFATNDQLVPQPDTYYAEFVRDALVRGDIATRWAAYMDAVTSGVYTRNEVRVMENKKKLPGLDEPLNPAHITGNPRGQGASSRLAQQRRSPELPAAPRARLLPPAADTEEGGGDLAQPPTLGGGKAEAITVAAARRLLRAEIAFVKRTAVAHADNQDAFAAAVTDFYAGSHVGFVERTLLMTRDEAAQYCAGQASQVLNGAWIDAVTLWSNDAYAEGLAALALVGDHQELYV